MEPPYGLLIPGESPATIKVTITIDKNTAQLLNQGREVLDDILILRLENGRDYYITVKASYARSCFGMSVDELVLYSDPIRNVPLDPIKRAEKYDPSPANALCVPKELWRIIDAIYEKGLQEPDLFVDPGDAEEVKQIRECLVSHIILNVVYCDGSHQQQSEDHFDLTLDLLYCVFRILGHLLDNVVLCRTRKHCLNSFRAFRCQLCLPIFSQPWRLTLRTFNHRLAVS